MAWNYSETEYQESKITIPAGKHRVRITSVVPEMSKTKKDMYKITLDVSGYSAKLFDYLVFMPDNPKMTNSKIGDIVHSFGVTGQIDPNVVPAGWVGAVGSCMVKLDEENRSKVGYYTEKEKAADLPPWKEPERRQEHSGYSAPTPQNAPPPSVGSYVPTVDETDLPFSLGDL